MITKPTLLIDETKCRCNIQTMRDKAAQHNLVFRPHFKTHQSLEIGRWFKDAGVEKITVSSLSMAEYFSSEWDDITIAFPVNILEIAGINLLAEKITLNLLIENEESITLLSKNLTNKVNIFLKIDVGYHRTGIDPDHNILISSILNVIDSSPLLSFVGFLGHSGHTYQCRSVEEVQKVHANSVSIMSSLKKKYQARYKDLVISLGDTPSCSVANDFTGVDEIRPGNFVFYDLTQLLIGSCKADQIAVALACPIVAKHADRFEIIIYGGGVHLSKERIEEEGRLSYGSLVEKTKDGWGDIISGTFVKSLSQEHGVISVPQQDFHNYEIGDYVLILPVHSCMTANLMRSDPSPGTQIIRPRHS